MEKSEGNSLKSASKVATGYAEDGLFCQKVLVTLGAVHNWRHFWEVSQKITKGVGEGGQPYNHR